jgi:hypothetical protein
VIDCGSARGVSTRRGAKSLSVSIATERERNALNKSTRRARRGNRLPASRAVGSPLTLYGIEKTGRRNAQTGLEH